VSSIIFLNFSNFSLPNILVKMFAICGTMYQMNSVGLYLMSNHMVLHIDVLCSIINLGFLANLIVEVLSIKSGVAFMCFFCKSYSIFLSHTISYVSFVVDTYSSSLLEETICVISKG
jgi:hypothetical protein